MQLGTGELVLESDKVRPFVPELDCAYATIESKVGRHHS